MARRLEHVRRTRHVHLVVEPGLLDAARDGRQRALVKDVAASVGASGQHRHVQERSLDESETIGRDGPRLGEIGLLAPRQVVQGDHLGPEVKQCVT